MFNKGGEQIFRELNHARRESVRKKKRADGAARQRREHIRNGDFSKASKPGDSRQPLRLDFNPKGRGGQGELKKKRARGTKSKNSCTRSKDGCREGCIQFRNESVVHPRPKLINKRPKALSCGTIRYILSNKSEQDKYQFSRPIYIGLSEKRLR